MNATMPQVSLLCKLGSIAVHVEELLSDDGHPVDKSALLALLEDPEVCEWMEAMEALALLPKKRKDDG